MGRVNRSLKQRAPMAPQHGFKTHGQSQLKSETEAPVAPQNGDLSPQENFKNQFIYGYERMKNKILVYKFKENYITKLHYMRSIHKSVQWSPLNSHGKCVENHVNYPSMRIIRVYLCYIFYPGGANYRGSNYLGGQIIWATLYLFQEKKS